MDNRKTKAQKDCRVMCGETEGVPVYEPELHKFRDQRGDADITLYNVFPGITLAFFSVHTDSFLFGKGEKGDFVEICHCREGRMEQEGEKGNVYIMPGDLSIITRRGRPGRYSFPLCHYHGIFISIDVGAAPECLSCFLEDVNVHPKELAKRLCGEENCFVIRSQDYIEHIFSELYQAPESCKKGYFKVKILELLLILSSIDPGENRAPSRSLSKLQADLAKKAAAYLTENLDRTVTVAELCARFHVSQTHLQNAFKGEYGVPVSSYVRILKMQSAALRLIHTDTAILDMAAEFGYSNAGKFASAFHKIMGETPGEYRKMHGRLT